MSVASTLMERRYHGMPKENPQDGNCPLDLTDQELAPVP
jgi:hypothetical protein